jgi:hypothetical protein
MSSLKELWNSQINEIQNELERPIHESKLKHKTSHSEYDFADQVRLNEIYKEFIEEARPLIIHEQIQLKESRKQIADAKVHVSAEEARHDLMTNKDSPFLFRKWLKLIQESGPEYIRNSPPDDPYPHQTEQLVEDYVGKHVIQLLGCSCGNNAWYRIHPKYEWNYDSGQWNIKALKGHCSYWSGHIGYCWEGTMSRENLPYAH